MWALLVITETCSNCSQKEKSIQSTNYLIKAEDTNTAQTVRAFRVFFFLKTLALSHHVHACDVHTYTQEHTDTHKIN